LDWKYNVDFGPNTGGNSPEVLNRWALSYQAYNDDEGNYGGKGAIVLYEYDTKKLWYLPAASCSGKGHAFPGGLLQTGVTLSTNQPRNWTSSPCELGSNGLPTIMHVSRNGLCGGSKHDWDIKKNEPISGLMDLMNFKSSLTKNWTSWDSTWSVFECWYLPTCVKSKVVGSGKYAAVGWVYWP
jgi:hypothetical protein